MVKMAGFIEQTLLVGHWIEIFRKAELAVDNSKVSVLPLFISKIPISKAHKPKCSRYISYPESYSLAAWLTLMVAPAVGSTYSVYLLWENIASVVSMCMCSSLTLLVRPHSANMTHSVQRMMTHPCYPIYNAPSYYTSLAYTVSWVFL